MSTMYLSIFTSFWRGFFTGVKSIISILTGAEQASGSILVFLDAHTEAAPGWLPPILNEIVQDRTRVIVPVVGMISHKKSLIKFFGHKHKIKNFIKEFDIFHKKISTAFDFGLYLE